MGAASLERMDTHHGANWVVRDAAGNSILRAYSHAIISGENEKYGLAIQSSSPDKHQQLTPEKSYAILRELEPDLRRDGFSVAVTENGRGIEVRGDKDKKMTEGQYLLIQEIFEKHKDALIEIAAPKKHVDAHEAAMKTALAQFQDPSISYESALVATPIVGSKAPNRGAGVV